MIDVLFLCVHNAGRSQMARALFNQEARRRGLPLRAEAAGTEPASQIHPNVLQAMQEIGLELSGERPKMVTDEMVNQAKRVITMGCSVESCPAVTIQAVEDWGLPDPKDRDLEEVRAIREMVCEKVGALVTLLASETRPIINQLPLSEPRVSRMNTGGKVAGPECTDNRGRRESS